VRQVLEHLRVMKVVTLNMMLELHRPSEIRLERSEVPGLRIVRASAEHGDQYRALYHQAGKGHLWFLRRRWRSVDFANRITAENVDVHLAFLEDEPAGFVELEFKPDHNVQVVFLGVAPRLRGKGVGKSLLNAAVAAAWEREAVRIWLYTRTYDGEHALVNYKKRGFSVFKVRPSIIGIPRDQEAEARKIIERAKARGVYPGLLRRLEGHLRESLPGRAARWTVYGIRVCLRRLKRCLRGRTCNAASR